MIPLADLLKIGARQKNSRVLTTAACVSTPGHLNRELWSMPAGASGNADFSPFRHGATIQRQIVIPTGLAAFTGCAGASSHFSEILSASRSGEGRPGRGSLTLVPKRKATGALRPK